MNKILDKWKPIIDSTGYTGNKTEQLAEYAEAHCKFHATQSYAYNEIYNGISEYGESTLPIALKILTKVNNLNLDNVKFTSDESSVLKDYIVSTELRTDIFPFESEDRILGILITDAIGIINKLIGNLNIDNKQITFNTTCLVRSISAIKEGDNTFYIQLRLSFSVN